jgi:ornithine cyclodeaminase
VTEQPVWLAETDVVSVMDMSDAIRALEAGLRAEARGAAHNMTKTHVEWDAQKGHATLHAIGAAFTEAGVAGTKTWAHTPGGATPLLILYDGNTGNLKAIIEAFALGQLRTAAASGVATNVLAARDATEFALIGTGKQSVAQAAAVAAVRPLSRVRVFGRDAGHRGQCATRIREELGLEVIEATTIADAVKDAPIVTCVTRAREPFLSGDLVMRGAHVNAVGAITPGGAEVTRDLLARCGRIVADSVPQAKRLSSELIDYLGDNAIAWNHVESLAEAVTSDRRHTTGDLTLFKSLGMGLSDLSLAIAVYERAVRDGLGRPLEHPRKVAPRLRRTEAT